MLPKMPARLPELIDCRALILLCIEEIQKLEEKAGKEMRLLDAALAQIEDLIREAEESESDVAKKTSAA